MLFQHDIGPSHKSIVPMAGIKESKFELLPRSIYPPPNGVYIFSNLKNWLGGKRFTDENQVRYAVNGYFEDLDKSAYQSGINALDYRWKKRIDLNGDHVDK